MKYAKTEGGNSPYLVEKGRAYFSVPHDGGFLDICTWLHEYINNHGRGADFIISHHLTLPINPTPKFKRKDSTLCT